MAPIFLKVLRSPLKPLQGNSHNDFLCCKGLLKLFPAAHSNSRRTCVRWACCTYISAISGGIFHKNAQQEVWAIPALLDAIVYSFCSIAQQKTSLSLQGTTYCDPRESIHGTVSMPCSLHACSAGSSSAMTRWGSPRRFRCAAQLRISST